MNAHLVVTVAEAVEAELVRRIATLHYPEGEPLPSTRELALEMRASRNSVLRALTALRSRGLIELRGGRAFAPVLAEISRLDALVELAQAVPESRRGRALLAHLHRFLRRTMAATAVDLARARHPPALERLRKHLADRQLAQSLQAVALLTDPFDLLRAIAVSADLGVSITLNCLSPLVKARGDAFGLAAAERLYRAIELGDETEAISPPFPSAAR